MSGSSSSAANNNNNNNNTKCCFAFRLFGSKPDPLVATDASTVDTQEPGNTDATNSSGKKKNLLSNFQSNSKPSDNNKTKNEATQQNKTLVVMFNKPRVDSYIGLSLKKYKRNNSDILVHSISPTGLLKGSPLKQGQKVVSINNIECPKDLKSTIDLLKTAPAGPMRIEVQVEQYDLLLS